MIKRSCGAFVVAHLLMTSFLGAAEPARDLGSMKVAPGALVYVRVGSGTEISGRFVSATSRVLVVAVSDSRTVTVPVEDIVRVWKHGDSLRNGAVIGAVIGLAAAIGGQSDCSDCAGSVALGIAVGVPVWSGIAAVIDRAHANRTLIYREP